AWSTPTGPSCRSSRRRPGRRPKLFRRRAGNGLKSLVFSLRTAIVCRKNGRQKITVGPQKSALTFLRLAETNRRTGRQGRNYSPDRRSRPPIPCADQRDPPGFPRPGGSVFWADASPPLWLRATECARGLAAPRVRLAEGL